MVGGVASVCHTVFGSGVGAATGHGSASRMGAFESGEVANFILGIFGSG